MKVDDFINDLFEMLVALFVKKSGYVDSSAYLRELRRLQKSSDCVTIETKGEVKQC